MSENIMQLLIVVWPIAAALISYIIGRYNKKMRDYFVVFASLAEFIMVLLLFPLANNQNPAYFRWDYAVGFGLDFKLDGFRFIYAAIASFMWLMTSLFSLEYFESYRNRNRYHFFNLITLGATVGILTSADLITTFVFFEMMSFASYALVAHDETPGAIRAANSFLMVGFIGGLSILIGIFMLSHYFGTTNMDLLTSALSDFTGSKNILYAIGALFLVGFGGKAGMFPLHFWLPKAHPVAPAPGSALLSGILTKTGIFGLLVISSYLLLHDTTWGMMMLIMGTTTMFLGAFLALFSIDLKRTLALSSVSQIGFIIFGIGMQGILGSHNSLAIRGTLLHMINHSLIKLVLFMAAGAIYMKLHKLDLNTLRGYGRKKPILMIVFLLGALSLGGIPLFSGFVSKTLLHESIVEQIWMFTQYNSTTYLFQFIEAVFMISGGFTVAYMTKLFVAIFIEEHPYDQAAHHSFDNNYMSGISKIALLLPAVFLIIFGVYPPLFDRIADFGQAFMFGHSPDHAVNYFAWINVKGALVSIIIGAVVYITFIRNLLMVPDENGSLMYVDGWPKGFDLENVLYRPLVGSILPTIFAGLMSIVSVIPTWLYQEGIEAYQAAYKGLYRPLSSRTKESFKDRTHNNPEKILTSHMEFGMVQYVLGAVAMLALAYFLNR